MTASPPPPVRRRLVRGLALLAGAGGCLAPLLAASVGEWSLLKGVVSLACLVTGVGLVLLAVGPGRWWTPIESAWQRIASTELVRSPQETLRGRGLILAGAIVATAHLGWRLSHPDDPFVDDQGAFLDTSREIAREGGLPALLRQLMDGSFAEANRHPLYMACLSFSPTPEFGRTLSAVFALGAWALFVGLAWREFGPRQAGIVGLLCAVNAAWGRFASQVVCETLLLLCSGLVWCVCLRFAPSRHSLASRREGTSSPPEVPCSPRPADGARESCFPRGDVRWSHGWACLLGLLLGWCYLTKGTGLVLLGCVVIWWLSETAIAWRSRRSATRPFLTEGSDQAAFAVASQAETPWCRLFTAATTLACIVVVFHVTAAPLLIRNAVRFGRPYYNDNAYLLVLEEYAGFREIVARRPPFGEAAREFLARQSWLDLARREVSGLAWEAYIIVRMLGPFPFDDARILFGIPLALLALAGCVRESPPRRRWFLTWFCLQWAVFAWYVPIAAGERFVLPLLGPLLVYAADGLATFPWRGTGRNVVPRVLQVPSSD